MLKIFFFAALNTLAAPFWLAYKLVLIQSRDRVKFKVYLRSGASFTVYAKHMKLSGKDSNNRWEIVSWEGLIDKHILSLNPNEIDAITYST
jgi:hypothetical protein